MKMIISKENLIKLFTHLSEKSLVVTLILIGLFYNEPGFEINKIICFTAAGIISGLYNGLFNDYIWRNEKGKTKILEYEIPYLIHTVFNHIVGGVVGAISLYLLVSGKNLLVPQQIKLDLKDLILLMISLVGYSGLIPRTLWFGSYGPTLGSKA